MASFPARLGGKSTSFRDPSNHTRDDRHKSDPLIEIS
jgi:hypothetical protein